MNGVGFIRMEFMMRIELRQNGFNLAEPITKFDDFEKEEIVYQQ